MKMLSRRWSFSRKLIWCRDLIRRKFYTGKRYNSEEGGWIEQLPDDVMQLILQRLPLSDYLNCRDVSRCWRAAINNKRWLPAPHQLPWLVVSSCIGRDMLASYIKIDDDDDLRINVSHQKTWKVKTDPPADCYCAGSVEGWLIITTSRSYVERFFFWNPVSGARVMLPTHHSSLGRFPKVKVVASSVPTTTECYVSCLHFRQEGCLAFCTPTDRSWTLIKAEKALEFWEIEILDGKLYALGREALEYVMVFDIHLDTHAYTSQRLVTLHPNINSIVDGGTYHRTCYLAKCCESKDLFMVLWHDRPYYQRSFQVLKLENNNKWVEIDDLGDQALFMATLNNKFITCHDKTLERNCIYFVLRKRYDYALNFGVFSLTDRSFKTMTSLRHHHRSFVGDTT
ncbi:PREDICTED: uncharacterized protein LOC101301895 [Fragaria vesca subsp. vesca]|uniref:uncharacterized protein LOC101301895 n=1 Tax=Fragaria vesca subsp. vesca TaxID=101020 RepID=UPI0002C3263B|nr:PREDICTED: uncharacterized protein LOC101301895 [Fragaria vesca subsp. vesca]